MKPLPCIGNSRSLMILLSEQFIKGVSEMIYRFPLIFFVCPDPRRKSIDSPWGWGKSIDFQAMLKLLLMIADTHFKYNDYRE